MTDDDEFEFTDRPCKIVIRGVCDAPANGGTRARCTCYSCGEPVCASPWCSRVRVWGPQGRRRICRDCDERDGEYADPEALLRYDRRPGPPPGVDPVLALTAPHCRRHATMGGVPPLPEGVTVVEFTTFLAEIVLAGVFGLTMARLTRPR